MVSGEARGLDEAPGAASWATLAARFAVQATTHPLLFWPFLFLGGGIGAEGAESVLPASAIQHTSTNVYAVHGGLYVVFTLACYALLLGANVALLRALRPDLTLARILEVRLAWWNLPVWGIGGANALAWIQGMEMNVFGFIFFLPLLAASAASPALAIAHHALLLRRPRDRGQPAPPSAG